MKKLVKLGLYPSVSEIIRNAVRDLLQKDLEFLMVLNQDQATIKKEIKKVKKRKDKIHSIFIPEAKRKQVERMLLKLGII